MSDIEKVPTAEVINSAGSESASLGSDDQRVAEHGYKPELRRHFSIWSLLGVGFGLTNSWFGISASLVTGISSGGPMLIVYGIMIVAFMSTCIGISLSELISAFPENSGGQYYWTFQLAPKKYKRFWAYMCGSYAWFGAVFTSASTTLAVASALVGMYVLSTGDPNREVQRWQVWLCFEVLNIFIMVFNIWDKPLPYISSAALYTSIGSFVVITITVLICSRGNYQDASFVFTEFNNNTGWNSAAIGFLVGLINPAWSFSCLDCATHMAEEIYQPEKFIPISIMATVAIGFTTSFLYSISMFFSIRNLDAIFASNTGVPILDIFYQALQNKHGALFLESLVVLTSFGCTIASQTWQARLCWSFSRDQGLPGSRYWSKVNKTTGLPINANVMSCFWGCVVGCIYMGSTTAYNAMVTGCITFLLLSYSIPIVCLLYKGRNNIKHGPFWLGPIGLIANIITLCWTVFALVFFCFPFTMPVTAGDMNYAAAVLGGLTVYAVAYWFLRAHKLFAKDHDIDEKIEQGILN
ncbi:Choline transport protein [Wickerhamomyces ciferrii]|uniref:Choline transport protein n=1 Tax=Wickerhamomyces ciferrii (strain ATCC 14091 / BCRC 22168 / CBS 111 / JCM 3599 / NBRC 0793 / NRRL Y-1031 F-60-10) TaxID=1206466 RepID=K0KLE5_WICCF|nr:Choline transport protein [Wickerhamomyces ciferrii]CCH43786.1 Choline transport protein [Wickerhamomyces ciferrii]